MSELSGRVALVTGGSRGIGRAISLALARAGARLLVHYGSNEAAANAVVEEIRSLGGHADKIASDLRVTDGAHTLAACVRALIGERLDILVANAGISKSVTIEGTTPEVFDNLFAVNVRAPFFLVQQLLPVLGSGSSIVLLSSLAAHSAVPALSAYSASKGAVETLVKPFAAELGARGIRVNAVAPGVVDTDMSSFARTKSGREFTLATQALKHLAQIGRAHV
jgi:NAD(P)-dependent dehydrogenase (short-subunit alcohol dehydrogenase family)